MIVMLYLWIRKPSILESLNQELIIFNADNGIIINKSYCQHCFLIFFFPSWKTLIFLMNTEIAGLFEIKCLSNSLEKYASAGCPEYKRYFNLVSASCNQVFFIDL